jgi:hypothetical protein
LAVAAKDAPTKWGGYSSKVHGSRALRSAESIHPAVAGPRYNLMTFGALAEWFPPTAIVHIPIDRRFEVVFDVVQRFPLQFALRKRGMIA